MSEHWVDGVVEVGGLPLHYVRVGSGDPVVLLHGFTDNARCWQRFAERLADTNDVVMLDGRNHGTSGTAVGSLADTASDAVGLIEALDIGPADVVGHSLGGCTAIDLAVRRPELVRRLVLEDPPWRAQNQAEDVNERRGRLLGFFDSFAGLTIEEIIEAGQRQHPEWAAEEFPAWAESKQQVRLEAIETIATQAWADLVPQLSRPTLLVHGEAALGGIVDVDVAAEAAGLSGHVSVASIAGAGHNIRREQLDRYFAAVLPFLAAS